MSILWCGSEDISFNPIGNVGINSFVRSGYARSSVNCVGGTRIQSNPIPSGSITSGWLSFWCRFNVQLSFNWGFSKTGNAAAIGIATNGNLHRLVKTDGTTVTVLVTEAVSTVPTANTFHKYDLHITSYANPGTIELYMDGNLILSYTGNLLVGTMTDFDCMVAYFANSVNDSNAISEIIIADEDTRAMSLVTNIPNAAGDANAWTGAYTDIDEQVKDDTDVVFTNATGQDAQFNLGDIPSGTFTIKAVKAEVRATVTAGSTPTHIALGFKSGGSIGSGTVQTPNASMATYEQIFNTNPVTSSAFVQSEINPLQLNLRSS
jgi:hypothetical protein